MSGARSFGYPKLSRFLFLSVNRKRTGVDVNFEAVFKFVGGGEAVIFEAEESPQDVANKLRQLADKLEQRK